MAFAAGPPNLKVIALDCDGVLFDSKEANVHFYNHIMDRIGRSPVRVNQQEYIHMYPVRESLLFLTGEKAKTSIAPSSIPNPSILARLTATSAANLAWSIS